MNIIYPNLLLHNCTKIIPKIKSILEFKSKNKLLSYNLFIVQKKTRDNINDRTCILKINNNIIYRHTCSKYLYILITFFCDN